MQSGSLLNNKSSYKMLFCTPIFFILLKPILLPVCTLFSVRSSALHMKNSSKGQGTKTSWDSSGVSHCMVVMYYYVADMENVATDATGCCRTFLVMRRFGDQTTIKTGGRVKAFSIFHYILKALNS